MTLLLPEWLTRPIVGTPALRLWSTGSQGALLWTLAIASERQLPLAPLLHAFADDEPTPRRLSLGSLTRSEWRRQVHQLGDQLQAGVPLPDALDQHPGLLPPEAMSAARIGWESGSLAPALKTAAIRLTDQQQHAVELFEGVSVYILTLSTVALSVIGFVMYYIIPKLKKIFEDFDSELPAITRFVIDASDLAVNYSFLFAPVLLFLAWWLRRLVAASLGFGTLPESRSLLGRFVPRLNSPELLRYLAIVVKAGRPVTGAVDSLARAHAHRSMRERLAQVRDQLERGVDCWSALQAERLIGAADAAVFESAERAGNLAWALEDSAERLERRINNRFELWAEFIRPTVLVGIGTVIGIVAIGVFMPLVKLINDLI